MDRLISAAITRPQPSIRSKTMAQQQVKTYCRFCHAYCPMIATVEDNRLLAVEPDTDNPV